jgi:hypothetical protein
VGIGSICILLLLAFPWSLGPLDAPEGRLAIAGVLAIGSVGLLLRRVWNARRRLLASFDDWAEAFRRVQDERDKRLAFESAQRILATIIGFCQWLLGSGTEEDFRPRPLHPWEEDGQVGAVREETNASRRRRFLNVFGTQMREAERTWRDLEQRLVANTCDAAVVRTLPDPHEGHIETLAAEALGAQAGGHLDRNTVRAHLRRIEECVKSSRVTDAWLPFQETGGRQGWAEDLKLPQESSGEDSEKTPAMRLFRTIRAYVDQWLSTGGLRPWIARLCGVAEADLARYPHSQGMLFQHLNTASEIPLDHGGGGVESAFILSTGDADVLAPQLGAEQQEVFSADLLCMVRVRVGLSAEEIIFGGDPAYCTSGIGRAFAAHGSLLAPLQTGGENGGEGKGEAG